MSCLLNKLTAVAAAVLFLTAAGCMAPPIVAGDTAQIETSHRPTTKGTPQAKSMESVAAAADDATVATVMQEVQQISSSDPVAGRMLLDELSRAEPKLWPLVLQQFRSQQAFHEQLSKRQRTPTAQKAVKADDLVTMEPPSAEVGKLGDPRGLRPDPALEQAFAAATPANMPAPVDRYATDAALVARAPAAFADDESARQLAGNEPARRPGTSADNKDQVIHAVANEVRGAQQALFNVEHAKIESPASGDSTRDWQAHLELAIDDLNERLAGGPRSTAEVHQLVSLRLLQLLAGETEEALRPIPDVSSEEQDYWSGQIFALATFLDHHRQPDDERRAAASVVHLDEAVGHLRELGTLSLRNLAFCKNVYGYGAYEPINNPSFTPGQQVTLYLEVENYHSESTQKGFSTRLGASYEVVNEAGQRVANGEFPNIEDSCQSRRRDFHIQYGLVLPKTVKTGKHHLKLVMKDRQSDKIGSASIAFEVQ